VRCVFAFDALRAKNHRRLQQFIKKRGFFVHQTQNVGANFRQTLSAKFPVQIARCAFEFFIRESFLEPDNLVVDNIRRGNQNHQNPFVRKIDKLDMLQAVASQRRRNDNTDIIRKSRKKLRGFFHQFIRGFRQIVFAYSEFIVYQT